MDNFKQSQFLRTVSPDAGHLCANMTIPRIKFSFSDGMLDDALCRVDESTQTLPRCKSLSGIYGLEVSRNDADGDDAWTLIEASMDTMEVVLSFCDSRDKARFRRASRTCYGFVAQCLVCLSVCDPINHPRHTLIGELNRVRCISWTDISGYHIGPMSPSQKDRARRIPRD